jgi:uncharacterized membrane protein
MRLIGAVLITYFLSRGFRRLGLRAPSVARIFAAHLLSLIAITLVVVAVRYPANAYATSQLYIYIGAQLLWLLVDLLRSRVAFWRAPVTPA